ncbi:hypothetical protein [Pseudostreptobacillus hongkongensis]|uniref:hypothetical protein n=1 Tax=Pseudostreptobacillus hongkongensis TaxID=1162717 RepID=UPI0008311A13|nr:hypothetical protein [Pseudostreptobacillus hongkongensis]
MQIEFDLNKLKNYYSFCAGNTIRSQIDKVYEEFEEVKVEVDKKNIDKIKDEVLDLITASINLLGMINTTEIDFENHINKLEKYKKSKYGVNNDN